eukprot:TRINITY_DN46761_c0_g1_i1.p1 TRINITY_DN46761_c0_g1~~TRINITY_DN46761_c0_g1_i1.p1  ORF type:complete len:269 (-),score=28.05 TRINITY_DN46761_c0_g1_i1:61-867(-)
MGNAESKLVASRVESAKKTRHLNLENLKAKNDDVPWVVVASVPTLLSLKLDHNSLTTIPDIIAKLSALRILTASHNKITSLPPQIFVSSAPSLTTLSLAHNLLSSIPASLGMLSSCRDISFFNNRITSIPPSAFAPAPGLGGCIRVLNLSRNRLQDSSIPESLGTLTSLEDLHLADNRLTAIPSSLALLPRLRLLDMSRNPLPAPSDASFPAEVFTETSLTRLSYDGCPNVTAERLRDQPWWSVYSARHAAMADTQFHGGVKVSLRPD